VRRAALLIALALAGCGGDDEPETGDLGAGEFLQQVTAEHLRGEYSETWDELHPAHQELITQLQLVYCGEREPDLAEDTTVRVLSVRPVTIRLPRVPERDAQAVRIELRDEQDIVDRYTSHVVQVDGEWRWVLSRPFLRALEKGNCLDGSPLPQ
jgi:hypothetical protein